MHTQYQLILQERGNKKLTTLTVVQAIFVPLTFIAGIYGMNFKNMQELQWSYGYSAVLIFMGLLTLFEIWWFKRNGWFD
jgi:magnesium transporter